MIPASKPNIIINLYQHLPHAKHFIDKQEMVKFCAWLDREADCCRGGAITTSYFSVKVAQAS